MTPVQTVEEKISSAGEEQHSSTNHQCSAKLPHTITTSGIVIVHGESSGKLALELYVRM